MLPAVKQIAASLATMRKSRATTESSTELSNWTICCASSTRLRIRLCIASAFAVGVRPRPARTSTSSCSWRRSRLRARLVAGAERLRRFAALVTLPSAVEAASSTGTEQVEIRRGFHFRNPRVPDVSISEKGRPPSRLRTEVPPAPARAGAKRGARSPLRGPPLRWAGALGRVQAREGERIPLTTTEPWRARLSRPLERGHRPAPGLRQAPRLPGRGGRERGIAPARGAAAPHEAHGAGPRQPPPPR